MHNPFIPDILEQLKSNPSGVKVYELMGALNQSLLDQLVDTEDMNLRLYRKNFWLMNALYQLQQELLDDAIYLEVGQLWIRLHDLMESETCSPFTEMQQATERCLQDYYFNWDNYSQTQAADVQALLTQFWQQYADPDALQSAGQCLGFDDVKILDWQTIKQRYRQLARQHHPDKGGSTMRFVEIRSAYETLYSHYHMR